MSSPQPVLLTRSESGRAWPMLIWRFDSAVRMIVSGPVGGGIGARQWVLNAMVDKEYARLDPDVHLAELAEGAALTGPGAGMLTAVDVSVYAEAHDAGVSVVATVGLGYPTWAAAPDGDIRGGVGTINIVAAIPALLGDGALVNAVMTASEAKAQALWDCGVKATGTATDALVIACTGGDPGHFGGPRSRWGAPLARAVHAAVAEGTRRWLESSDR